METLEKDIALDPKKLEAFIGKAVLDWGSAFSTTLTYIGDKLGLYKAMAFAGPMNSKELAEKTGTSERYLREWLINQAAGGYLEFDEITGKYILPDEHAVALTDEDSPYYVVGMFELINGLNKAEERVTDNFKTGQGMAWGEHHHNLFHGTERFFKPSYIGNLIQNWLPALDGMMEKLNKGISVADIGCGHGVSTLIMARNFPKSTFMGFDSHQPSIDRANELAKKEGLKNVKFEKATAKNFPGKNYDFIAFFDCLHDLGDPINSLKHCYELLKDDGTVMLVEPMGGETTSGNFNPVGRVYSGASVMVCTPNALADGGYALGTVASDSALENVATKGNFTHFRKAFTSPFNRVFELKK